MQIILYFIALLFWRGLERLIHDDEIWNVQ